MQLKGKIRPHGVNGRTGTCRETCLCVLMNVCYNSDDVLNAMKCKFIYCSVRIVVELCFQYVLVLNCLAVSSELMPLSDFTIYIRHVIIYIFFYYNIY